MLDTISGISGKMSAVWELYKGIPFYSLISLARHPDLSKTPVKMRPFLKFVYSDSGENASSERCHRLDRMTKSLGDIFIVVFVFRRAKSLKTVVKRGYFQISSNAASCSLPYLHSSTGILKSFLR